MLIILSTYTFGPDTPPGSGDKYPLPKGKVYFKKLVDSTIETTTDKKEAQTFASNDSADVMADQLQEINPKVAWYSEAI